jgi:predicted Rossmann-fold nucleotide-binding protein
MQGYERGRRESLSETLDGRIYEYFKRHRDRTTPVPIMVSLALRIHDHAVDDALVDLLFPHEGPPLRVVGVMGGHGMLRTDPMYPTIVEMCRRLSLEGYMVATGGGPGAMEAANLGAYLVGHDAAEVGRAVEQLGRQPAFEDEAYLDVAYELVDRLGPGGPSLAIPTWYYGHEPTNLFASGIAKYFDNSLREEGLLAIAKHGVVYAPGSAGTLQEVFMDTTQNHYGTLGEVSPMVFLGSAFWGSERPVIPLLEGLAGSRPYRSMIGVCDSAEDAVRFIVEHPPVAV